jgi:hypothetical protein
MFQFERHFTLDEARALLPMLRRVFKIVQRLRQRAQQTEQRLSKLLRTTGGDVGGESVAAMLRDLTAVNGELTRVQGLGVVIKDIDRGLVDFPHLREGREVFLCWELDEDDIEFWHDLETGYAGRERL